MKKYKVKEEVENAVNDLLVSYGDVAGGPLSPVLLMEQARQGLTMLYLHDLCDKMGVSLSEMSTMVHVSLRTLQRYPDHKVLDVDLSSKLLLLTDLYAHGIDVFGADGYRKWLRSAISALGHDTPLSMLDNPFGIRRVDDTLGQLAHGVFA